MFKTFCLKTPHVPGSAIQIPPTYLTTNITPSPRFISLAGERFQQKLPTNKSLEVFPSDLVSHLTLRSLSVLKHISSSLKCIPAVFGCESLITEGN